MPRETTAYFRVRSVLASRGSRAITLSPGRFLKDSETETIEAAGETYPAAEDCGPWELRSEFDEAGGKMTELRLDGEDLILDLDPEDLVEVRVQRLDRGAGVLEEAPSSRLDELVRQEIAAAPVSLREGVLFAIFAAIFDAERLTIRKGASTVDLDVHELRIGLAGARVSVKIVDGALQAVEAIT